MSGRGDRIVLAAAGLTAAAMPIWLLLPGNGVPPAERSAAMMPIIPATPAPLARLYERPLFAGVGPGSGSLPLDAPQLLGIAGRLGGDAVALVRTGEGRTRSLAVGESVDGWRLDSLAIDAALFTRGSQHARVPLPADQ